MGDAKNRGSFFERVAQSQARAAEAAKKLDAERAAWNAEVTTIAERLGMQLGTSPLLITREKVPRPARVVLVGLDELLARVKFWTSGPLAAKPVTDALRAEIEANVPSESAVPATPDTLDGYKAACAAAGASVVDVPGGVEVTLNRVGTTGGDLSGACMDPEFDPLTDCGPGDGFGCDDCEECPNGEEV